MGKKQIVNDQLTHENEPRGTLRYHLLPPIMIAQIYIVYAYIAHPLGIDQVIDQYTQCLVLIAAVCVLGLLAGMRMGRTATNDTRKSDLFTNRMWLIASIPMALFAVWIVWSDLTSVPGQLLDSSSTIELTIGWILFFSPILQPGFYILLIGMASLHGDALLMLLPLCYRLLLMLGYRISQYGKQHRRPQMAVCLVLCLLAAAVVPQALLWHTKVLHQLPPGYGFAYENGLSSTDLSPYNPFNPDNILPTVDSSYHLQGTDTLPVLDGAEAAYPVYAAFANACFDDLQSDKITGNFHSNGAMSKHLRFSNTLYAYEALLDGEVNIYFGAMPSAAQRQMAEEAGVELILTPIALEGFVFITSPENPVHNLTVEDIRGIYSGKITNWRKLGGYDDIVAFQRPKGSGSQTLLEHIMGDTPIMQPLEEQYIGGMFDLINRVADYRNNRQSLGYTFRFFLTGMHRDIAPNVSMMSINGVQPTAEAIRNGSYPFATYLYAVTVKGNSRVPQAFLDWMQGPEAQQLVSAIGYIPLTDPISP